MMIDLILIIVFTTVILSFAGALFIIYHKVAWIEILSTIISLVIYLVFNQKFTWLNIVIPIILGLLMIYYLYSSYVFCKKTNILNNRLYEYLNANELDYFFQTNEKDLIIAYSKNIYNKTTLTKKDLINHVFWTFIFDYFTIQSINNETFNLEVGYRFLSSYKEASSKHKVYSFEMIVEMNNQNINFLGIIEPLYYHQKLIGRNIYLYQDRMQIVDKLKNELSETIQEIEDYKDQAYVLMSLANQVVLYYDYQSKTYIASEAFCRFTSTHQKEYVFSDILDMIHPDDYNSYLEQTETINSIVVTRIKFRLNINNEYYYVMEDSLNLKKDDFLVSIIRVINKVGEEPENEAPLSTKEALTIIDRLNSTNITKVVEEVETTLDTVIGETSEKKD